MLLRPAWECVTSTSGRWVLTSFGWLKWGGGLKVTGCTTCLTWEVSTLLGTGSFPYQQPAPSITVMSEDFWNVCLRPLLKTRNSYWTSDLLTLRVCTAAWWWPEETRLFRASRTDWTENSPRRPLRWVRATPSSHSLIFISAFCCWFSFRSGFFCGAVMF